MHHFRSFHAVAFLVLAFAVFATLRVASAAPVVVSPVKDIVVTEDDRVVSITWNGGVFQVFGIGGYYVYWGPVSNMSDTHVTIVEYPIAQLQPIENGVRYRAQIVAVDYFGWTSTPSPYVNFTGNSARVDQLRRTMTGFFEDYNVPEGPVDELTWNTAWYSENDHIRSGLFVNHQFHLHNMLASKIDPSDPAPYTRVSFSYMRPRAIMSLANNETRTIVFDIDGHSRTNWWMLDVLDADHPVDLVQHQDVRTFSKSAPANHVRFQTDFDEVHINYFGADYLQTDACLASNIRYYHRFGLAANVRIPWKIKVSRYRAEIYVRDILICSADIFLPFERAILLWGNLSYRSEGSRNMERWISHWDNFGFDGPPTPIMTYNYKIGTDIGDEVFALRQLPTRPLTQAFYGATVNVTVLDPIDNAIAARVHFCVEMSGIKQAMRSGGRLDKSYLWSAKDRLVINGTASYSWPDYFPPKSLNASRVYFSSAYRARPLSIVVKVSVSDIRRGINTLQFSFADQFVTVTNVHIELDYSTAPGAPKLPPYTQPAFRGVHHPSLKNLSTGLNFAFWNNDASIWYSVNGPVDHQNITLPYNGEWRTPYVVKGSGVLTVKASGEAAVQSSGLYPTLNEITLEIDHQVYWRRSTSNSLPTPSGIYRIPINTTQLTNGIHEVFVWGWSSNGVRTLVDHKDIHPFAKEGYWPLLIDIQNPQPSSFSPNPTPSLTMPLKTPFRSPSPSQSPLRQTSLTTPSTSLFPSSTPSVLVVTTPSPSPVTSQAPSTTIELASYTISTAPDFPSPSPSSSPTQPFTDTVTTTPPPALSETSTPTSAESLLFPSPTEVNSTHQPLSPSPLPSHLPAFLQSPSFRAPTPSPSSTPSPTGVTSRSPLRSPSRTPTRSGTRSPTRSSTRSRSRSPTRSGTCTPTRSRTRTPTRSPIRSLKRTPTRSRTRSPTRSRTRSPTRSRTRSPTRSRTRSPTRSRTRSPTRSRTPSRTRSPTRSHTRSPTRSHTRSLTPSRTRTATRSRTRTPTRSRTRTPTRSRTRSPLRSRTRTPTRSPIRSPTRSRSRTPTRSFAGSPTRSRTRSFTRSRTRSLTRSRLRTLTAKLRTYTPTGSGSLMPLWPRSPTSSWSSLRTATPSQHTPVRSSSLSATDLFSSTPSPILLTPYIPTLTLSAITLPSSTPVPSLTETLLQYDPSYTPSSLPLTSTPDDAPPSPTTSAFSSPTDTTTTTIQQTPSPSLSSFYTYTLPSPFTSSPTFLLSFTEAPSFSLLPFTVAPTSTETSSESGPAFNPTTSTLLPPSDPTPTALQSLVGSNGRAPDQFGISPFDTTKDTTSPSVTTSRSTILLAVTVPLGAIVFVAAAIFTLRKVLRKSTQTIPGHTPPQEEVHHGSARQTQIYPDSPSPDEVERR